MAFSERIWACGKIVLGRENLLLRKRKRKIEGRLDEGRKSRRARKDEWGLIKDS